MKRPLAVFDQETGELLGFAAEDVPWWRWLKEVEVIEGSYRYKSWFGVEWTVNKEARQAVVRIVLFGLTFGLTGGVSVGDTE